MDEKIEKALGCLDRAAALAYLPDADDDAMSLEYNRATAALALLREELERLKAENFKLKANDLRFYKGKAECAERVNDELRARAEKAEAERDAEIKRGNEWHDHADAAEATLARFQPLIEAAGKVEYLCGSFNTQTLLDLGLAALKCRAEEEKNG